MKQCPFLLCWKQTPGVWTVDVSENVWRRVLMSYWRSRRWRQRWWTAVSSSATSAGRTGGWTRTVPETRRKHKLTSRQRQVIRPNWTFGLLTSVWTMERRCDLISETIPKMSAYSCSLMCCMRRSRAMNVPVLPTPALIEEETETDCYCNHLRAEGRHHGNDFILIDLIDLLWVWLPALSICISEALKKINFICYHLGEEWFPQRLSLWLWRNQEYRAKWQYCISWLQREGKICRDQSVLISPCKHEERVKARTNQSLLIGKKAGHVKKEPITDPSLVNNKMSTDVSFTSLICSHVWPDLQWTMIGSLVLFACWRTIWTNCRMLSMALTVGTPWSGHEV